jgi:hypothetical protein
MKIDHAPRKEGISRREKNSLFVQTFSKKSKKPNLIPGIVVIPRIVVEMAFF